MQISNFKSHSSRADEWKISNDCCAVARVDDRLRPWNYRASSERKVQWMKRGLKAFWGRAILWLLSMESNARVASHLLIYPPLPLRPNWMVEDEDVSRKGISHGVAENQTFVILLRFDLLHPSLGKRRQKNRDYRRTDGRTGRLDAIGTSRGLGRQRWDRH